jgi:RHS repeat-associated protein
VAGNGSYGFSGDGGPATAASLNGPCDIAVAPDGSLYIADSSNRRIRGVSPDGTITTVAGNGSYGYNVSDGSPATATPLDGPYFIALGPDGSIHFPDIFYLEGNYRYYFGTRKVTPSMQAFSATDFFVLSKDKLEIYHFDSKGRHLRTMHALTGVVIFSFTYDDAGLLTVIEDANGNTTTILRDTQGNPLQIVSPFGQAITLGLDGGGYLATITDAASISHSFTYTDLGLLTTYTDPNGNLHQFAYDGLGRLTKDTNPAGGFSALARSEIENGYAVMLTTAENRSKSYTIENLPTGDQRRVNTFPDGTVNESLIGTNGSTKVTFADGTTTELLEGPDPRFGMQAPIVKGLTTKTGGLTSVITSTRTATLTDSYDPLSLTKLTDTVTVNGRTATSVFDAAIRSATTTSAAGRQSTIALDNKGRLIQSQIPGIFPVDVTYDANGRLATISQGSGADERELSLAYNPQGYLQTATDVLGHTHSYEYDVVGRITKEILPDSREILYDYDANDNLVSLTTPSGSAHVFKYTKADQTSEYAPPDVGAGANSTLYEYNLDKDLTRITRPDGKTIDFTYDGAGRLSGLALPNGDLNYTYSGTTGKLTGITDPDGGTLAFTYAGALLTSAAWTGTVAGNVGFTYDNDFRLTGVSVNGADSITYQYDADSLLTNAGSLTLSRSTQNGMLTGSTLGNVTDVLSYNSFGEAAAYEAKINGASLFKTDYTYDKLGQIVSKVETQGVVVKTYEYSYDPAGRLTEVKLNGAVVSSYTYDDNGNRLSHSQGPNTIEGTYDEQDRLITYGNATFTYSANGELESKTEGSAVITYDYDVLGNLRKVILPTGQTIDYIIDAANRRVSKKVNGALLQGFLYQDQLKPVAELDGSGTIVSRFVYAAHANVPDYMVKGGNTYRIVTDHLGSPRYVVNTADGSIAQQMDYDEFGNIIADSNPGFQPFGFAGGLYDGDTQLLKFGARDYDPNVGRWIAKDPIGFDGGDVNLYGYVGQNPILLTDPTGTSDSNIPNNSGNDEVKKDKKPINPLLGWPLGPLVNWLGRGAPVAGHVGTGAIIVGNSAIEKIQEQECLGSIGSNLTTDNINYIIERSNAVKTFGNIGYNPEEESSFPFNRWLMKHSR